MSHQTHDDVLDVSLRDLEPPPSPEFMRSSVEPSEPATTTDGEEELEEGEELEEDDRDLLDSEIGSVGGFSPPAWRRHVPTAPAPANQHLRLPPHLRGGPTGNALWRGPVDALGTLPFTGESSPDRHHTPHDSDREGILERAIRTRLPRGSESPFKRRSASPERPEDVTLRLRGASENVAAATPEPPTDNYIRIALRAEVQQRTEPIETAIRSVRKFYTRWTATWTSTFLSILVGILSISALKALFQAPAPRPAGDLVKVAGVARSFEPLIYYSEHAVTQVHDLQATSIAVWDLGESVRLSDMRDAASIVADLDALSETMKTLAEEMTRFFARVDGDIDAILNVMDWAKMHLNHFHSAPPPSTLSSAYDNVHNLLSQAHILEDSAGAPTPLGTLASWVFGPSNPQREQRMVQLLFREFITVLEDSIQSELQHSVTLFALFETVDRHFLNLARTVVREVTVQDELHADLLSGLWSRILGPRAAQVRKFEQNRLLLQHVREKTVRNKGILVEHNGKLLTLKASLESLRSKLVSPLVRGINSTTLSLENQIRGISDVSGYLSEIRKEQKGKVMQTLYGSVPSRKYMIEEGHGIVGQRN